MTSDRTAPESPSLPEILDVENPFTFARGLRIAGFVAAVVAIAVMWLGDRYSWLDYQPGGTAFFNYVRPVFYVMLALGALLAIKWEVAGGVVGGFAAGAIGAIAVNQLIGRHAAFVIALLAVPSGLWVLSDLLGWSRRSAAIGAVGALAAVTVGAILGELVYERQFGPTHPSSDAAALPDSALRWVWSGGTTTSRVEVRAKTRSDEVEELRLVVAPTPEFSEAETRYFDAEARDGRLVTFDADGLGAGQTYHYAVEVDGEIDRVRTGSFSTFADSQSSFRVTVGACARVGSNGSVFDAILAEGPLFHLISGDFHYGDIPDDNRERYDEVIDLTLRQPAQAALYRSVPIAYMWDDHDYGANDSNFASPSRVAAMQAYRANVPSYELAGDLSAIYQSFDVGRVRFLLTDARSAREPGVTMLGGEQLEWFVAELVEAADEQALVVWVNPVPWVADESPGADHWGGFADERRLIADVIADNEIDNLMMISGDAHMVAIDDGTNTDYSTSGGGGFPLMHAAALDRPGSTKGGPYSEGERGGTGQYGVVDIADTGDTISVALAAKRFDGAILMAYDFEVAAD